jgi:hypothetical protein
MKNEKYKEYKKQWYLKNRERILKERKKYYSENKDKILEYHKNSEKVQQYLKKYRKEYYDKNKEKISQKQKEDYKNNKEFYSKRNKKYREEHKEQLNEYCRKYRKNHKEELNKKYLYRKNNDDLFKFKCNIRNMIKKSFNKKGLTKKQKGEKIYGCSMEQLIKHLIKTYENNYSEKWDWNYLKEVHIDHIKPLKYAKNEEEVINLCHYTNLQLLKAKDNLRKSNKLDWSINDE